MEITDIRINLTNKIDSKLKAFASITIDNLIVIHYIKIIEGKEGVFVLMPCKSFGKGKQKDIVHPINSELSLWLTNQILDAYYKQLKLIRLT